MKLIPKRESLQLTEEVKDYLSLYDIRGNLISRSSGNSPKSRISLTHDKLEYIAETSGEILVTWKSINNKFNKKV